MFDFTLPNSLAVLPVENLQNPDPGHALGQATADNAPPPLQKLIIQYFEPTIDQPSLGQLPDQGAPPPQKLISQNFAPPIEQPNLGQLPDGGSPPRQQKLSIELYSPVFPSVGQSSDNNTPPPPPK